MLLFLLGACATKAPTNTSPDLKTRAVSEYLDSHANYATSLWAETKTSAQNLDHSITSFQQQPSEKTLKEAQDWWLRTRLLYSQTEALRFQSGPIDHPETGVEGFLNAWPLDEAYVDYIQENPNSGIINDTTTYPEITRELLISLNEKGGEECLA